MSPTYPNSVPAPGPACRSSSLSMQAGSGAGAVCSTCGEPIQTEYIPRDREAGIMVGGLSTWCDCGEISFISDAERADMDAESELERQRERTP